MTHRKRRSDRAGREALRSPGRPTVARREELRTFWASIATGHTSEAAAIDAGVSPAVGVRWFRRAGGMAPSHLSVSAKPPSDRYLSFAEREEIAILHSQTQGARDRSPPGASGFDDLAGAKTECCDPQRRPGVSCLDRAVACGSIGASSKALEAGEERRIASLRSGSAVRPDRVHERHEDARSQGHMERTPIWTAAAQAMVNRVEPRTDRPSSPSRLPR